MPTYSNNYDRGQFGVAGGYMGTGVELQPEIEKVYQRLLSPAEWEQQDQQVTSAFGGYMNYVNAFTSRQRSKKAGKSAFLSAKAGTFEPQMSGVSWGAPTSTRGRIPTAGKSGVAIPKTTIHRDISGRPTQEIAGGGVRRSVSGQVIPQTAEQYGEQIQLDRAIPTAKLESDIDFLGKVAKVKELKSTAIFDKRREALIKAQQAATRLQQQADAEAGKTTRLTTTEKGKSERQAQQQKNMLAREKERQANKKDLKDISQTYDLDKLGVKDNYDRIKLLVQGKIVGSKQEVSKRLSDINDEISILRTKQKMDISEEKRKALIELEILAYKEFSRQSNIVLTDWSGKALGRLTGVRKEQTDRMAEVGGKISSIQSQAQKDVEAAENAGNEVRREVNGRIAVFNADTKKFIRWE